MNLSLQNTFAPQSLCFGCGPQNSKGLRIQSFVQQDAGPLTVVCEWQPEKYHEAFSGMVNGGILGAILDCHCNWTAAWALYSQGENGVPIVRDPNKIFPCTVTAEYSIKLLRPTPSTQKLYVTSKIESLVGHPGLADRAWVTAELKANEKVTALCRGLFVAVKEGHPAFHRWG